MAKTKTPITDWEVDWEKTYYALYWWPFLGRRPRESVILPGHCPCGCGVRLFGKQKTASPGVGRGWGDG